MATDYASPRAGRSFSKNGLVITRCLGHGRDAVGDASVAAEVADRRPDVDSAGMIGGAAEPVRGLDTLPVSH